MPYPLKTPGRNGVVPAATASSRASNLPLRWSKTENIAWKTPLPGWGTSTPAIWKDAVFVTSQQDDRLLLLRLDSGTGKIVWQREVGKGTLRRKGPLGNGRFHDEHNLATPSPVTDGKHVWVHFGNGDLACYDFAGKQIWLLNLTQSHGPYTIWWGHGNSPILFEDLLISVCMQDPKGDGQSYIVAHDKVTGKEKWFVKRVTGATAESADSYTTPLAHQASGPHRDDRPRRQRPRRLRPGRRQTAVALCGLQGQPRHLRPDAGRRHAVCRRRA